VHLGLVPKPHFLDSTPQERRLPLPQEDQTQTLPPTQPVLPTLLSAYNSFQKAMPMVNQDRKHYTPCFILQEEQVQLMPCSTIMPKMTANC
jgi:hypothetical protein